MIFGGTRGLRNWEGRSQMNSKFAVVKLRSGETTYPYGQPFECTDAASRHWFCLRRLYLVALV